MRPMRIMFALPLVIVLLGSAYIIAIGLLHR